MTKGVTLPPSLTVIICIHNAPDYCALCIDSVLKHTTTPYTLILVDDGSDEKTALIAQDYANQHDHIELIRHAKARGYTKAANAGLRSSTSDYTILLNSDTLVSPRWAEKMLQCGESNDTIGIIGPLSNAATYQSIPYVFEDDGSWKQNRIPSDITVASYANEIEKHALNTYPEVPIANGFCFCIKRAVIHTIGYLDEETFPQGYGEENDYCLRAADAGFSIVIADDTYIYHATSQSFGEKAKKTLTRKAHHAIRSKYSEERLDNVDRMLRHHQEMERIRLHYATVLKRSPILHASPHTTTLTLPAPYQEKAFLFLLPDCSAYAGGSQVIVELARGLDTLGVKVHIAIKASSRDEFEKLFQSDVHLFTYYKSSADLMEIAAEFHVAIATIFHSIRQLTRIVNKYPHIQPAYFVQDYEPFFSENDAAARTLAENSYTMIHHNLLFAISPWVQEIIKERHHVSVEKITAPLEQELFFPNYARPKGEQLVISAMVRPSTARRSPERTIDILHRLKQSHGKQIAIRIFGATDNELRDANITPEFPYTNYGILQRQHMARLLADSDIFLDLSEFQAFGRTALEAMACGCAVIAPERGGVKDYGDHNENIILTNTVDSERCLIAINMITNDSQQRETIRRNAIAKAQQYSIHRAALSFLEMMYTL